MKKIFVFLILVFVLALGVILLLGKKDDPTLQALDSYEFRELINLDSNSNVFYVLEGNYDGIKQRAYLDIFHNENLEDSSDSLIAKITLWKQNHSFEIALDDKILGFALDNKGMLIISGINNGVEFKFHQDSNAALNQMRIIKSEIYTKTQIEDRFGKREVFYRGKISKPIIVNSDLNHIHLLNQSISDSNDIYQLKNNLEILLKNNMNEYIQNYGLQSNVEFINQDSIGYIDDNILEIDTVSYRYTGGAHGNSIKTMQLYDINSGAKIPSGIEDVFDVTNENKDKFLILLSSYLESKRDQLFDESLPLTVMPNSFFLSQNGVIFMWNAYEIAPYSSGNVYVVVEFDKIKELIKDDWHYKSLFYGA